ncbi:Uncharacterised protein [Bordetella pertussis]|nr:Uncharacterised protein [Bordetella pertussis]
MLGHGEDGREQRVAGHRLGEAVVLVFGRVREGAVGQPGHFHAGLQAVAEHRGLGGAAGAFDVIDDFPAARAAVAGGHRAQRAHGQGFGVTHCIGRQIPDRSLHDPLGDFLRDVHDVSVVSVFR